MWKEFRDFALRGNVIDIAIGMLVGGAFNPIARSLVDHVLMPPIGLLLGNVDFANLFVVLREGAEPAPYATPQAAAAAGAVTLDYGIFLNTVVSFAIVAFVAFWIARAVNRIRRSEEGAAPQEPSTRSCPECLSPIPLHARRCAHCTARVASP